MKICVGFAVSKSFSALVPGRWLTIGAGPRCSITIWPSKHDARSSLPSYYCSCPTALLIVAMIPRTFWLAAVFLGVVAASSGLTRRSNSLPPLSGKNGGVATEVGQCSDIGIQTMKAGGNAADSIISSALCVGTIAAYHSGIGGGGFMIVRFNKEGGGHGYEMVRFFHG